jgi:uncharacterized protein YdeI (YjbR/CyaY-like superfamily)
MKKLVFRTREDWRAWLVENHDSENEVWLVYYKKATGKRSIAYSDSVEEALCFGWIDSIIKRIDETKYVRKFTPRLDNSNWSALNIKRAEKMIQSGKMTLHGMRLVESAKATGRWDNPVQKPTLEFHIHPEFAEALNQNRRAKENFEKIAPTYRKQYIGWVQVAKRETTRRRRIDESVRLLEQGKKLGLK